MNVRPLLILILIMLSVCGCHDESVRPDVIYSCGSYSLTVDSLCEGNTTVFAAGPLELRSNLAERIWAADSVDSRRPVYTSPHPLMDAVYNRAISVVDTLVARRSKSIVAESGGNTRDLAYAVYLSLALINPEASMDILRSMVTDGRIVGDSGLGGGWPIITDRIVWTMAAWEVYKVTGDREWLKEAYTLVEEALKADLMTVWDSRFNLLHGSQNDLTGIGSQYPGWATPVDRYESMCLSNNVAYARALAVAAEMASELKIPSQDYRGRSQTIATAVNDRLWIPNYGFYSQYLYGGVFPIQSYATDNLGQALAILYGVASPEMARSIIVKTPQTDYGVSNMTPLAGKELGGRDYSAITQAVWNVAAAKVGVTAALSLGTGALYRRVLSKLQAADSLDRLYNSASILAMTYRINFGIDFTKDGIEFHPVLLPSFAGEKCLANLRYRKAVYDITLVGTGNSIAGFSIDGVPTRDYRLPAALEGHHSVTVTMANNVLPKGSINKGSPVYLPGIPHLNWTDYRHVSITNYNVEYNYSLYVNGVFQEEIGGPQFELWETDSYRVTDIAAVADNRWIGYTVKPHEYIPDSCTQYIHPDKYTYKGTRLIKDRKQAAEFVELTTQRNTHLTLKAEVANEGTYLIALHYANGNGPVGGGNKCGIRTLFVNGRRVGTLVMPQRGEGNWTETAYSNTLVAHLKAGVNILSIDYVIPYNENMDKKVNTVLVDYLRLIQYRP